MHKGDILKAQCKFVGSLPYIRSVRRIHQRVIAPFRGSPHLGGGGAVEHGVRTPLLLPESQTSKTHSGVLGPQDLLEDSPSAWKENLRWQLSGKKSGDARRGWALGPAGRGGSQSSYYRVRRLLNFLTSGFVLCQWGR